MANIKHTKYTHRFLARFIIECKTPLAVGSGDKDIKTDALVATDVNGLPFIPATSIAGVVRSMIGEEKAKLFFGKQSKDKDENRGSEIIFTEAKILDSKGDVVDGLNVDVWQDELLKEYRELPVRQHVRITDYGVADAANAGKFDEQVVFAGTRFCFELEMVSDGENYLYFEDVLKQFNRKTFRLGGGTRSGFGQIEVISLQTRVLDLRKEEELSLYLDKTSKLENNWLGWTDNEKQACTEDSNWIEYKLTLQPEDFFLFSSGFGDQDADMTPVKENKVIWNGAKGHLSEDLILIPATSVKGALSHRVAFHWNKLNGIFAERLTSMDEREKVVGGNNKAVQILFGYEDQANRIQQRGNLLFTDIIEENETEEKILNHVAIDRFTGGAINGALFSEKATYGKGHIYTMTIMAKNVALESEAKLKEAFESALLDICKGLLPLGGGVNRGNGVFKGTLSKNGEVIS